MAAKRWSGMSGAQFRVELRRLNLTQQWFAEQCGFELSTVAKWCADDSVTSGQPVPQYAAFILQLLDRLAYRGEMRDISDQVEAFVRMIVAGTLVPPKDDHDASRFAFAGNGLSNDDLIPKLTKRGRARVKRDDWLRTWRVSWRDTAGISCERWYSQRPSAFRKVAELRKLDIAATIDHAPLREGI